MRTVNSDIDTLNAAAAAIVTAERRVQQVTSQRRRWGGCLSTYWCFGYAKNVRRIGNASLSPDTMLRQPAAFALPFIAPPSSPTSASQSELPSAVDTPMSCLSSFNILPTETYLSPDPPPMFAIGPYAHETQLVSPPIFSTFTTEPSTASRTPPEPTHPPTSSLPELPLSQLLLSSLDSNLHNGYRFDSCSTLSVTPRDASCPASRWNSVQFEDRNWAAVQAGEWRGDAMRGDQLGSEEIARIIENHFKDFRDPFEFETEVVSLFMKEESTSNGQHVNSITDLRLSFELEEQEVGRTVLKEEPESETIQIKI